MTTRELIEALQRIDPSGNMRVRHEDVECGLLEFEVEVGEHQTGIQWYEPVGNRLEHRYTVVYPIELVVVLK